MKVAFQGERGAYSENAILAYYGRQVTTVPCETFELVFTTVQEGVCERGLVPIENSLAGSVHRNYDLLLKHQLSITGEYHLRVRHCLVGIPGATIPEIKQIISHPQALAQCEGFVHQLGATASPAYDTAGSLKIILEKADRSFAAIASRQAAELYQMEILAEGIEDDPANFTRFLTISTQPEIPTGIAKTSIVFTLKNIPGALYKALSVFALRDIDLTKIESRPLIGKPWEYLFYIDFAGSVAEKSVSRALENLSEYALTLRLLGSYPRHLLQNGSA